MWIETTDGRLVNMDHVEIITAYGENQAKLWGENEVEFGTVDRPITELRDMLCAPQPLAQTAPPVPQADDMTGEG